MQHPIVTELIRKSIHLTSAWIPLLYIFTDFKTLTNVLMPLTALTLLIDILRTRMPKVRAFLEETLNLKAILRNHELDGKFSGATYVLIGALFVILAFPKPVAIAALWTLVLSDTAASIVGKLYGKHPLFGKSWEGSIAFALTTWAVIITTGMITHALENLIIGGALVAIIVSAAELFAPKLRIDDNLLIPVSTAFFLMMLKPLAVTVG